MTVKVLVAGDANLDLVLAGDVVPRFGQAEQLLESAQLVLGSSAGICASGLARLGTDVALVARVGRDLFGDQTVRLLRDNGVDTAHVLRADAPTGLSVILSGVGDRAILTLTGAMAALTPGDVLQAMARTLAMSEPVGHLHIASFFLLPVLAGGLPELLAEARAAGFTTSLDTNWDPAETWAGVEACLPHLDLLLPNAAEAVAIARSLGGESTDVQAAARFLAARGPIVAVKDGAAGGFAVAGDGVFHAPGLALEVVDTTGAGDSFDAGFLSAWLAGDDLATAVRWGTAAGSLSTRGFGGTGGQPTRAELAAALAAAT
ncbi:MAG TPA: carbohydrate kinase family protein [Propionicimonas sp.]|jgi:sugar/nucleoside kinase (ribokinase family)|uniref:carbohydrate kinase family protein n=1 Tax=Propionicimonas sp. TaxID=1955623 RepID=UPI002F3FC1A3